MLWIILLLVILLATGTLWAVLKVAAGVAIGLLVGFALITGFLVWRIRRSFRGPEQRWRPLGSSRRFRRSSRIEVLDPRYRE